MTAMTAVLPAWVFNRDGRLVAFDPDRIALSLFEASESFGEGDAFLARELTEAVLHFLAEDMAGSIPSTGQVAETTAKVVRELGHSALARSFIEQQTGLARATPRLSPSMFPISPLDSPATLAQNCLAAYSLRTIFARDLQSAHENGLITIHGLTAPLELFACVAELADRIEPGSQRSGETHSHADPLWLLRALQEARDIAGGLAVLDGPEFALAARDAGEPDAAQFCDQLATAHKATGLQVILNLNAAQPPRWASDAVEGPLFAGLAPPLLNESARPRTQRMVEHLADRQLLRGPVRLLCHVRETDFGTGKRGQASPLLLRLARLALDGQNVTFAFDRPRRPHLLGPGLSRGHAAVLLAADLHLPQLLALPGLGNNAELFLRKVGSLMGMAISAALQKRNFLRERSRGPDGAMTAVHRRFLLARARLAVEPVGLAAVVRHFTGEAVHSGKAGVDFARRVLQVLTDALRERGARSNLDGCLCTLVGLKTEGGAPISLGGANQVSAPAKRDHTSAFGTWSAETPLRDQLRAAGQLHAFASGAAATLLTGPDRTISAEEFARLVHFALTETSVQQLTVRCLSPQQLTLPGL